MKEKNICLLGTNKKVKKGLENLGYIVHQYGRNTFPPVDFANDNIKETIKNILEESSAKKFLILSGYLQNKSIIEQNKKEITDSLFINAVGPILSSEYILKNKNDAQIIILGSESGQKGSYDTTYALSKASLRMYVKQKYIKKNQKLLLLSPSTIEDFGMTERRSDKDRLENYKINHPKERFLKSEELINCIDFLFKSTDYLTNTEIELNGGKFASK